MELHIVFIITTYFPGYFVSYIRMHMYVQSVGNHNITSVSVLLKCVGYQQVLNL